ncbi:damage-inducible protein DinB [Desulfosporosinus fructosivorans]|uniref:Damage-inducible protein DinB n=1 Tax=Desulfosporosinus fructosivorans TaxID=2018669 RepID=A0A4Z0R1E7_9FIRM|nr:DinB family protein [Desulfosporosinus fructosivorans]TGE36349.1 damage-inducible protein DinB [Desulfosporosinus fructosivorans]
MNKRQIIELYSYNDWANKKILYVVTELEMEEFRRDLSSSFKSIGDTMVHILGAEELWLSRWMGEQGRTLLNPDHFPTHSLLADRWDDYSNQINSFILSLTEDDLTHLISYRNLKGIPYTLELWKQMLHVTNHSSYHRGQIVTMLRQLKKKPPALDLINYYLEES